MKKMKNHDNLIIYIMLTIIIILMSIGSYKFHEWKLENIWNIENPTFLQVIDSVNNRSKK